MRAEFKKLSEEVRVQMFREAWAKLLPTLKAEWSEYRFRRSSYQNYRRAKMHRMQDTFGIKGKLQKYISQ